MTTEETMPVRVIATTALESMVRGEVDIQVKTAHMYPRNLKRSVDQAMALATMDEETATDCMYAISRGGKRIEGGSARLAEILTHAWGNMRTGSRIVDVGQRTVTAQAVAHDLEANNLRTVECTRRITYKDGRRYDDDMIVVTSNAAASIAARNAVLAVIPRSVWWPIYLAAKDVSLGKAEALADKRNNMVKFFEKMGIGIHRVVAAVQRTRLEDVTRDDLATLKGIASAVKSGETTLEDAFPTVIIEGPLAPGSKPASKVEKLTARIKGKTPLPEPAEPIPGEITPEEMVNAANDPGAILDDDPTIVAGMVERAANAFLKASPARKAELRKQFGFTSSTEFTTWKPRDLADLIAAC